MKSEEPAALRVVVVDDSIILRQRLVGMLRELDRVDVIREVEDRDGAISEIATLKPDIVILDIQLKNGNGIEVLSEIKKANPSLAVIMLTNYPYPQFRAKCMAAGADYFFYKATEFARVKEVVQKLVANSV